MAGPITWRVAGMRTPATADGIVTGRVWLTLHGVDFPGSDWSDFPLSVLGSAVTAYAALRDGEPDAFSYIFDGSYFLYYRRTGAAEPTVHIEANCDEDEENVYSIATGEVLLDDLRAALLDGLRVMRAQIDGRPHTEEAVRGIDRQIGVLGHFVQES
ncbi:hypothetical protein [Actinoplanes palleronii]|uniref:Uncharacterized protein n=1 Tax=Actinoplanes palleronii TaxID=113570 RepID=A0ABQ4BN44_9ACTN|nr:hypothetical protein [Actinoplanes palleronii]GIE71620.1 hypothetical protein Apa02nite_077280 [Actinoplanes palleronii]